MDYFNIPDFSLTWVDVMMNDSFKEWNDFNLCNLLCFKVAKHEYPLFSGGTQFEKVARLRQKWARQDPLYKVLKDIKKEIHG